MTLNEITSWEKQALFKDLLKLDVLEIKKYCLSRKAMLRRCYHENVLNVSENRRHLKQEFVENMLGQNPDNLWMNWPRLEYDFLFEDRFELYLEVFADTKYREIRFEFMHEALFFVKYSINEQRIVFLGLSDKSIMVKQEAILAASYSLNKIFLPKLIEIIQTNSNASILEDCEYACRAINEQNQHRFINRCDDNDSNPAILNINDWDFKSSSPPGLQEHLLANMLILWRNNTIDLIETANKRQFLT